MGETSSSGEAQNVQKKLSEIPCFRETFLYSISSGLGAGLAYFLATSNIRRSCNYGIATYATITVGYWLYCRYNFAQQKFNMGQLQSAMQKKALYEGTEKEKELLDLKKA